MLSYEERRRLAVIEQQLTIDDPALARRFANHRYAAYLSRRVAVLVLGSLCAFATSVGLMPADVLLVFLAAAPAAAAAYDGGLLMGSDRWPPGDDHMTGRQRASDRWRSREEALDRADAR